MSNIDRYVRLTLLAVIIALYYTNVISGTLAIVLGVVGGIFLLTSMVNFCPLYRVLGISTRKKVA